MTMKRTLALLAALPIALAASANAAGGHTKELKHVDWSWGGVFGGYDDQQLQRGYEVYAKVCSACHSMKLVAFRHLGEKGGPYYLEECPEELNLPASTDCSAPAANPFVKAIAAEFQITDGVDDSGDPFVRPGLPADYIPSPYPNRQMALLANGGAYPPDQSLIVKGRPHGDNYIYSLLTGYPGLENGPPAIPEEIEVPAGSYYNPYYAGDTLSLMKPQYLDEDGHVIAGEEAPYGGVFKMAPPLTAPIIQAQELACGQSEGDIVSNCSKDVVAFLQWASEPKLEQRKTMGQFVILYLIAFAGIVYASYRQIWRNVEH